MIRFAGFTTAVVLSVAIASGITARSVSADDRDPTWSDQDLRVLQSLSLQSLGENPSNPSNRVVDNPGAAALGEKLFFDPRLSGDGEISCATCHQPDLHFTDGLPRSRGAGDLLRNAPTVVGAAHLRWLYWDGRRDSLWSQALIPIESEDEMASSRAAALRLVLFEDDELRSLYENVFDVSGTDSLRSLPANAGPFASEDGQLEWSKLTIDQQRLANRAYSNIGKALEAYQRTLAPQPTRFDRYVDELLESGVGERLSPDEVAGLRLFIDSDKTQCLQCHNGPLFTNGDFHNIGTGVFTGPRLDFGREIGLRAVLMDEFNCIGPYSDAEKMQCRELLFMNRDSHLPLRGAFKVPSLRDLKETAPYFHDGRFENLVDVLRFYVEPPSVDDAGPHELRALDLTDAEIKQLVSFLMTISS